MLILFGMKYVLGTTYCESFSPTSTSLYYGNAGMVGTCAPMELHVRRNANILKNGKFQRPYSVALYIQL